MNNLIHILLFYCVAYSLTLHYIIESSVWRKPSKHLNNHKKSVLHGRKMPIKRPRNKIHKSPKLSPVPTNEILSCVVCCTNPEHKVSDSLLGFHKISQNPQRGGMFMMTWNPICPFSALFKKKYSFKNLSSPSTLLDHLRNTVGHTPLCFFVVSPHDIFMSTTKKCN